MTRLNYVLTLFALICLPTLAFAQSTPQGKPFKVADGIEYTFESKAMAQNKQVIVGLPANYHQTQTHYPVLYITDGHGFFPGVSTTVATLASVHAMPEVIVVAVKHKNRRKELAGGSAPSLAEFITEEVMPFIDKKYRTANMNILFGHSLGGSFALNILQSDTNPFNAHIAISPVIDEKVKNSEKPNLESLNKFLANNGSKETFLYLARGNETGIFEKTIPAFKQLLSKHSKPPFNWSYQSFEKDSHGTVAMPGLHYGLLALFRGWIMPQIGDPGKLSNLSQLAALGGIDAIKNYYQQYSKRTSYNIAMPTIIFSRLMWMLFKSDEHEQLTKLLKEHGKDQSEAIYYLGHRYYSNKQINRGINIFKLDTTHHPKTAQSWQSLAYGYKLLGEQSSAIKYYTKAVAIAKRNNDPQLAQFQSDLEQIKQ